MTDKQDKRWHSENTKEKHTRTWDTAMGGFVWTEDFMPDEIKTMEYGPLFAYMYRRFGVPEYGSDSHKEIANWYVTTPDPSVSLCVSPRPSGVEHSFGFSIDMSVYNDRRNSEQIKSVESALSKAMLDLLTPVFVRDVPINGNGLIPNDSPLMKTDDECPHFEWAGFGVVHEYFKDRYA